MNLQKRPLYFDIIVPVGWTLISISKRFRSSTSPVAFVDCDVKDIDIQEYVYGTPFLQEG